MTKNLLEKKNEKWTIKGNDKYEDADSLLHDTTSHTQCLFKIYKILGAAVPEKSLTKKLLENKKNGQIKTMVSMRMLSLSYTIQHFISNVCTKFQNPRCCSS